MGFGINKKEKTRDHNGPGLGIDLCTGFRNRGLSMGFMLLIKGIPRPVSVCNIREMRSDPGSSRFGFDFGFTNYCMSILDRL
jgi:hypothetical protein